MTRDEAVALLEQHVPAPNLKNHCLAVGWIMRALAERLSVAPADADRWEVAGIVHDLDYATTADDFERHGRVTVEMLEGSIDEEMAHAILAHARKAPRESLMDKALYAADPVTGFIVAAALVRPDKSLAAVEVSSLKKRWKEKAFARGASREQMASCAEFGLDRDEFLALSLATMQAHAEALGL
ncbi:HD domain-containing protein [Coriobacteriia bacterium Es71-Z0120]|uniref:HD domain-containing protein n=1 Tax=Parvivirga hydrogeniphila TaxID=2939460 RepID=UPI002260B61D|nr:HD domain-containing protein [Parvivirga hydrogeniphila]MCL4079306.1 HD domain-containing protein [Parvivirga hydrogeniphila]